MSGHSKWSTIKHKKAKTDAQRGKIFTKIVREISTAARIGGGDIDANPRLRIAVQKAKDVNMPSDNIKRAIQKGTGSGNEDQFEEITFEAYASDGIAMLIETLTDNRNRTVPNIRSLLSKVGGSLATKGAVAYQFSKKGIFIFEPGTPEEQLMDVTLSAGADDIINKEDGSIEVLTTPEYFEAVREACDIATLSYASASLEMVPQTTVSLADDKAEKILKLIEKLEDDDDVQAVYSNAEFSDEALAKFA